MTLKETSLGSTKNKKVRGKRSHENRSVRVVHEDFRDEAERRNLKFLEVLQFLLIAFLFGTFFSISNSVFSQNSGVMRMEIEVKYDVDNYFIVPIGEQGVILFNPVSRNKNKSIPWVFTGYNSEFSEIWTLETEIPLYHSYINHFYDSTNHSIYLMFAKRIGERVSNNYFIEKSYLLLKFDIQNKTFQSINGTLEKEMVVSDFKVWKNNVWFGGYSVPSISSRNKKMLGCYLGLGIPWFFDILKFTPQALLYYSSFNTGKSESLKLDYNISSKVRSININQKQDVAEVLLEYRADKKKYEPILLQYNLKSELINTLSIPIEYGKEISNCKLVAVNSSQKIILGTYSPPGKYKIPISDAEEINAESSGIYIGVIDGTSIIYSHYYSFSELMNNFSFLGQMPVGFEFKKNRSIKKGNPYEMRYNILLHDIIYNSGVYLIIAEAYYPEYRRICNPSFDYYGRYYEDCYYVFEGYRFTHSYIISFDSQGRLLWNNTFEIGDVLSNSITDRVRAFFENEEIVLLYSNNGNIRSKVIKGNEITGDNEVVPIETAKEGDEVKVNYSGNVEYWYGKFFIAYGIQKIKNDNVTDKNLKKFRTVLYFNKIQYN